MRVALSNGDMSLELDPDAGGTVCTLRHGDLHVLRPGPSRNGHLQDPRAYAAFPMFPFVGRIHNARFRRDGQTLRLPANLPPEPHAIHGHGWQAAWNIETKSRSSALMAYHHLPNAWPWEYVARQSFLLNDVSLDVTLSLTNQAPSPMPAGFGWHPYFPRKDAELKMSTTHKWTSDPISGNNHPSVLSQVQDLSYLRRVERLLLDTTFSVRPEPIELIWPTHAVSIEFDPIFSHATVFVPPGEDYFCVEPVTHTPNAINSSLPHKDTGFHLLEPGETMTGSLSLKITF